MNTLLAFDLDGTLVDSRLDLAESANEMLATYAAPPLALDAVVAMVGDGARVLIERVLAAAGVVRDLDAALVEFLAIYDRRLLVHTRPYPSLVSGIEVLASRASLAVLTNKPEHHTRRILEGLDLSRHFRWVIGGDSGFPRKPDPSSLRHLMVSAGVTGARTVYVGDLDIDAQTARRAGATFCAALWGFAQFGRPLVVQLDHLVAHQPGDLLRVLETRLNPT